MSFPTVNLAGIKIVFRNSSVLIFFAAEIILSELTFFGEKIFSSIPLGITKTLLDLLYSFSICPLINFDIAIT